MNNKVKVNDYSSEYIKSRIDDIIFASHTFMLHENDDNKLIDEILDFVLQKNFNIESVDIALKKTYHLKQLVETMPYSESACLYLSKYFNFDFSTIENKKDLVEVLKTRTKLKRELFLFISVKDQLKKVEIDTDKIFKFCLGRNEDLDYLNMIIKENRLDEFLNIYSYVKNMFFNDIDDFEKYNIFLKCAYNYYKNPSFYRNLIISKLNDTQVEGFYKYFSLECNYYNVTIDSLEEIGNYLKIALENNIRNQLSTSNDLVKELLIKYLFNISKNDLDNLLFKEINIRVLEQIEKSTHIEKLKYRVQLMKIILSFIEALYNIMNNHDSLINFIKHILKMDNIDEFRKLLANINNDIRNIYEMEANEKLSDLCKYTISKKIVEHNKFDYIDLTGQTYTLYAHVYRGNNIQELVKPKLIGKQTICVSVINELSQEFCFNGITVGYTYIPKGNFITSSNKDLYSDELTYLNSVKISMSCLNNRQMTLRDLANFSSRSSETLLYREGMIPSCIIIRGLEPSKEEINASLELTEIIQQIPGYETHRVPLVRINQSLTKQRNDYSKISLSTDSMKRLEVLENFKKLLVGHNEQIKQVTNISLFTSENKNIYQCKIDGEIYLLLRVKSKNYKKINNIYISTYHIRKLVRNIAYSLNINDNLIFKSKEKVRKISILKDNFPIYFNVDETREYIAYKFIEECTTYEHRRGQLSDKEIFQFILEFIIDYLTYNNGSIIKEFYYDSEFNISRLSLFKMMNIYDDSISKVYTDLFNNNTISNDILLLIKDIAQMISSIQDITYLEYYKEYLNSIKECNELCEIKRYLLKRKNNLNKYLEDILFEAQKQKKI